VVNVAVLSCMDVRGHVVRALCVMLVLNYPTIVLRILVQWAVVVGCWPHYQIPLLLLGMHSLVVTGEVLDSTSFSFFLAGSACLLMLVAHVLLT
jgi:hypothetical protein